MAASLGAPERGRDERDSCADPGDREWILPVGLAVSGIRRAKDARAYRWVRLSLQPLMQPYRCAERSPAIRKPTKIDTASLRPVVDRNDEREDRKHLDTDGRDHHDHPSPAPPVTPPHGATMARLSLMSSL